MPQWAAKLVISLLAIVLVLVRLVFPDLQIDAVTLGLLVLAVLPWLASFIKSAEFPGGWKIEFRDVQAAVAKVTTASSSVISSSVTKEIAAVPPSRSTPPPSDRDPNLVLVGLRIEIEK